MRPPTFSPSRILIVEDDPTTRETLRYVLIETGHAVLAVSTVASALEEVARDTPDAILVDFHLGSGDGLECLRRLRETAQCRTVPVAIITGDYFLDETAAGELNRLGARIHFKPLWEEDVLQLVRELLAQPLTIPA